MFELFATSPLVQISFVMILMPFMFLLLDLINYMEKTFNPDPWLNFYPTNKQLIEYGKKSEQDGIMQLVAQCILVLSILALQGI